MVNVDPAPGRESTRITPSCLRMIEYAIASPRPVPLERVEKNGSKILLRCSGAMPVPLSRRTISTYGPGVAVVASSMAANPSGDTTGPPLTFERAAAGHRLHGVEREVVEHLHDLAFVGLDRGQRFLEKKLTCTPVPCVAARTAASISGVSSTSCARGRRPWRRSGADPSGHARASRLSPRGPAHRPRGQAVPRPSAPRTGCPAWR